MTILASERSWLLDPGLLKLVHQCRRLIHSEFGVKLHLTEEHLGQQLADYARKTRSSHLTRTWETLKAQVPQLNIEEGDGHQRTYRGQVIADDGTGIAGERETAADESRPRKKKVIYRGREVG